MAVSITMKELLEAGVHFGHQTKRWNPKMKEYIFGERNGIYIIDLQKTLKLFKDAMRFVGEMARQGKNVLFVGTKRQAQEAIAEEATRCGMYYVNHRWLGGMLTNLVTVQKSIKRLKELDRMLDEGGYEGRVQEGSRPARARAQAPADEPCRHQRHGRPAGRALRHRLEQGSHRRQGSHASSASRSSPSSTPTATRTKVDYVIPGNDDALRAIRLFTRRSPTPASRGTTSPRRSTSASKTRAIAPSSRCPPKSLPKNFRPPRRSDPKSDFLPGDGRHARPSPRFPHHIRIRGLT